jgi:hypothetical protein
VRCGAACTVDQVAISDEKFRLSVVAAAIVLALGIAVVRFCGSVSLPAKPAPPAGAGELAASSNQLLDKTAATPAVYRDFIAQDAQAAGVRVPILEDMTRKLPYRVDDARHVLEVGQRGTVIAGLELAVVRAGESLALDIRNTTQSDLAYLVVSVPTPNVEGCAIARPLPFNAMVLAKGEHETRVECEWRADMAIAINRVETLELSALSAWYVNHVPPELVGIEPRIARGHRTSSKDSKERCAPMLGQAVRSGIENGEIGWRDLVDFYARHRCQTYSFPLGYRAFTSDAQHSLPVTATER